MKKFNFLLAKILLCFLVEAQPNCTIFSEGSICRKACLFIEKADNHPQGSRASQELLDSAISICPTLAYAWAAKSVPYLKRGDFITWRKLLDPAVELEPRFYLGYRAGCLFECLRDYSNALADIERLEKITGQSNVGNNANGDYDLRIVKALCERELGLIDSCISTFEKYFDDVERENNVGLYDYYHFGVTLYKLGKLSLAKVIFEKQVKRYERFSETYYFLGLIFERGNLKKEAQRYFRIAHDLYTKSGYHRNDPYCIMLDQVFLAEIEEKLASKDDSPL